MFVAKGQSVIFLQINKFLETTFEGVKVSSNFLFN